MTWVTCIENGNQMLYWLQGILDLYLSKSVAERNAIPGNFSTAFMLLSNMGAWRKLNFRWLCIHKFPTSHWGPFQRNTFVRVEGLDSFSLSTNHFIFSWSVLNIGKFRYENVSKHRLTENRFFSPWEVLFPVLESAKMHCRAQFGNFGENFSRGPISTFLLHSRLTMSRFRFWTSFAVLRKVFFEVAEACSHSHKDISPPTKDMHVKCVYLNVW